MKFTELFIDAHVLTANVFGDCGQCYNKHVDDLCNVCKNTKKYVMHAMNLPCVSIIMFTPRLYERYYHTGVVTYFTVVGGYMAILEFSKLMCNPDVNDIITDKTWLKEAKPARQCAQNLLNAIPETHPSNTLFNEGCAEKCRLKIIQSMEHRILYTLAVMRCARNYKSPTLERDVNAVYNEFVENDLSRSITECTTSRCGSDMFDMKVHANNEWNAEFLKKNINYA